MDGAGIAMGGTDRRVATVGGIVLIGIVRIGAPMSPAPASAFISERGLTTGKPA